MLNHSTVTNSLYPQRSLNFFHTLIFSFVSSTSPAIILPMMVSNPKPIAIVKAPITTPVLIHNIFKPIRRLNTISTINTMMPIICAILSVYVLVSIFLFTIFSFILRTTTFMQRYMIKQTPIATKRSLINLGPSSVIIACSFARISCSNICDWWCKINVLL